MANEQLCELFRARVKFDYDAEDSTELTISAQEEVAIFKENENGWWFAEAHDGSCGWVPSNFLERIQQQSQPSEAAAEDTESKQSVQQEQPRDPYAHLPLATSGEGCGACNRELGDLPYVLALDRQWHEQCFVCNECRKELADIGFAEIEGKLLCEADYALSYAPKCGKCTQPIVGAYVSAMDQTWHPDHFTCTTCDQQFADGVFRRHEGKPYCDQHYKELHAAKCVGCGEPVVGKCFQNDGHSYHPDCFQCAQGHLLKEGETFFSHDEYLFCEQHYKEILLPKCKQCAQIIEGEYFTVRDETFHAECFACQECSTLLSDGRFDMFEDRLLCVGCSRSAKMADNAPESKEKPIPQPKETKRDSNNSPEPKTRAKVGLSESQKIRQAASERRMRTRPSAMKQSMDVSSNSVVAADLSVYLDALMEEEEDQVVTPRNALARAQRRSSTSMSRTISENSEQESSSSEQQQQQQEQQEQQQKGTLIVETVEDFDPLDTYPLESLARKGTAELPKGVDPARREEFLNDAEFDKAFSMSREEFRRLKVWKQKQLKRSIGLF